MDAETVGLYCKLYYYSRSNGKKVELFLARSGELQPDFDNELWVVPNGTIFSAYYLYANYFPKDQEFWICKAGGNTESEIVISRYVDNQSIEIGINGNFEIIAYGKGNTYCPRLKAWWKAGDRSERYARLCAQYLKPRITKIPESELVFLAEPQPTDAVLGGDAAFQKWLSTAAVLGGKKSIN